MSKDVDPNCRGCIYAPPEGEVIDSDGSNVTDMRIGDQSFESTDSPKHILQAAIANTVICSFCRSNGYLCKEPAVKGTLTTPSDHLLPG